MKVMNKGVVSAQWLLNKAAKRQRQLGASTLEYIMLAAIIVVILLAVGNSDIGDTITTALTELFETAADTATDTGSGG